MRRFLFLLMLVLVSFSTVTHFVPATLFGQDPAGSKSDQADGESKKKETVEAKLKPMVVYESFDGIFESTRTHEVKTSFETWTDLMIDSVVEEGTAVTAGQEILKFDREKIDKAVVEAEFAFSNANFAMETAALEKKEADETFELDRESAERKWTNTKVDFEYYKSVLLPQKQKDIDYEEKTAAYMLEYSQDELNQLEQMYTEDELTEESEEIVLKRARRSVESAERSRDRTMLRVQRQREFDVPREQTQKEEALKREQIGFQRSQITLPIKKKKTEIALAQAEFALKNKQENLKELRRDQQKMTLTAPADGILYYGRSQRGKWVGAQGSSARRLEPFKKVPANAAIFTIVDVSQLMIRANLDESKLDSLSPRMRGKALIKAAGNTTITVMIKSVSRIPLDDGKFDCQIMAENIPAGAAVMPGMSCKLSFLVHENQQAVVVPKASVFSDDENVTHYVYLKEGDEFKRQEVTVGHSSGDDIEIVSGISAGDSIAKSKP